MKIIINNDSNLLNAEALLPEKEAITALIRLTKEGELYE